MTLELRVHVKLGTQYVAGVYVYTVSHVKLGSQYDAGVTSVKTLE